MKKVLEEMRLLLHVEDTVKDPRPWKTPMNSLNFYTYTVIIPSLKDMTFIHVPVSAVYQWYYLALIAAYHKVLLAKIDCSGSFDSSFVLQS